MNKLYDALTW